MADMKRALGLLLLTTLIGCGDSQGVTYDLENDFRSYGNMFNIYLYIHNDLDDYNKHPKLGQYVLESARFHYLAFNQGVSTIYQGPPMVMNFGNGQGPQTLVNTGQFLYKSGYNPSYYNTVRVAITVGPAVGYGPMGPGHHNRAISKDTEGNTIIVVQYDKLGEGKGTLDGFYTMLQYYYNNGSIPKDDQIIWHTKWAEIFAIDESISLALRNTR